MGLAPIDYLVCVAYLVTTVVIAVRSQPSSEQSEENDPPPRDEGENSDHREFFLANRSIGSCMVGISVMSALFSGITFLGAPGQTYQDGISLVLMNLAFLVDTPITNWVFIPLFFRLNITSAYEYLSLRFGMTTRAVAALLFLLRMICYLATVLYAPALALAAVTPFPTWLSIIVTGVISCAYTVHGGMRAVIYTDVFQFLLLMGGLFLICFYAIADTPGGLDTLYTAAADGGKWDVEWGLDGLLSSTQNGWLCIIAAIPFSLAQMATDQISVQRYLSAKSMEHAQRALWLKLTLIFPVAGSAYVAGVLLWAYYNNPYRDPGSDPVESHAVSSSDQVLPWFALTVLPQGLTGLIIAAVLAATMSTVSSGVSAVTAVFLIDIHPTMTAWRAKSIEGAVTAAGDDVSDNGDEELRHSSLRTPQLATAAFSVLIIIAAFGMEFMGTTIVIMGILLTSCFGGPLLGIFSLGVFSRYCTEAGALGGASCGAAVLLVVLVCSKVCKEPEACSAGWHHIGSLSFMWYTALGSATTWCVGLAISHVQRWGSARPLAELSLVHAPFCAAVDRLCSSMAEPYSLLDRDRANSSPDSSSSGEGVNDIDSAHDGSTVHLTDLHAGGAAPQRTEGLCQ